jgi:hypothetical protein
MEEQLASFRPHLLVHDDTRSGARGGPAPIPKAVLQAVPHRLEVLYSDGMDALLSVLRDASIDDQLRAVDTAASLADREESSG